MKQVHLKNTYTRAIKPVKAIKAWIIAALALLSLTIFNFRAFNYSYN